MNIFKRNMAAATLGAVALTASTDAEARDTYPIGGRVNVIYEARQTPVTTIAGQQNRQVRIVLDPSATQQVGIGVCTDNRGEGNSIQTSMRNSDGTLKRIGFSCSDVENGEGACKTGISCVYVWEAPRNNTQEDTKSNLSFKAHGTDYSVDIVTPPFNQTPQVIQITPPPTSIPVSPPPPATAPYTPTPIPPTVQETESKNKISIAWVPQIQWNGYQTESPKIAPLGIRATYQHTLNDAGTVLFGGRVGYAYVQERVKLAMPTVPGNNWSQRNHEGYAGPVLTLRPVPAFEINLAGDAGFRQIDRDGGFTSNFDASRGRSPYESTAFTVGPEAGIGFNLGRNFTIGANGFLRWVIPGVEEPGNKDNEYYFHPGANLTIGGNIEF